MTYKASSFKSVYVSNVYIEGQNVRTFYFPVVKFNGKNISDSYYLNSPQETRYHARKIAKEYIQNLN